MSSPHSVALGILVAPLALLAGEREVVRGIEPSFDLRLRYEHGRVSGLDSSHAATARARVGLATPEWHGWSGFVEGEFTRALVDDYHGGAPGARPFDPANTPIFDPETTELNQAWLQFRGTEGDVFRLGRQRIILDQAAFVGNVGWRQNEQTFDAVSFQSGGEGRPWTLHYSWIGQVNRIFGSDADFPVANRQDVSSNVHNLTGSRKWGDFRVGMALHWMEFDGPATAGWDNRTLGLNASGTWHDFRWAGEASWQDRAGPANDLEAWRIHATLSRDVGAHTWMAGLEYLERGFQTPLATVHAFNGFADAFAVPRISGAHDGIADLHLSHAMTLPLDLRWTSSAHLFGTRPGERDLGWELDSVLSRRFSPQTIAILKFACFRSRSAMPSATRVSLEMNHSF